VIGRAYRSASRVVPIRFIPQDSVVARRMLPSSEPRGRTENDVPTTMEVGPASVKSSKCGCTRRLQPAPKVHCHRGPWSASNAISPTTGSETCDFTVVVVFQYVALNQALIDLPATDRRSRSVRMRWSP